MAYHFLNANEQVLMEGGANKTIFLGFNKGGMLILTNQRLIFKATFSSKIEEIPLASILTSGDSFNLLIPTGNMVPETAKPISFWWLENKKRIGSVL